VAADLERHARCRLAVTLRQEKRPHAGRGTSGGRSYTSDQPVRPGREDGVLDKVNKIRRLLPPDVT
jgi:hypothetical protein